MANRLMAVAVAAAVLSGCAAINASGAASDATATGTPASSDAVVAAQAAGRFTGLTLTRAVLYRDGGTAIIEGRLASGEALALRLDRKIGSETYGIFFLTPGGGAERLLERAEAGDLVQALQPWSSREDAIDTRVVAQVVEALQGFRDGQPPKKPAGM